MIISRCYGHYFIHTGTTCMLYAKTFLDPNLSDPYTLILSAYNPDNTSLVSDRSEASVLVYIGDSFCLIDMDPEEYMVTLEAKDVTMGEPVVVINASSSCGDNYYGDVGFNITNQMYYAGEYCSSIEHDEPALCIFHFMTSLKLFYVQTSLSNAINVWVQRYETRNGQMQ